MFLYYDKMTSLQLAIEMHGDNAQFLCTALGIKPIRYRWLKNGKPLEKRRVDYRMNASHPILKLKDLVLSDNGNYTCIVWNKFGSIQHSFKLNVIGMKYVFHLPLIFLELRYLMEFNL